MHISILLLMSSSLVHAKNPPVVHLVTEHLQPYQIEDENKNLTGFSVEVIKETLKRSQLNYTLNSYPWVRSYKLAQKKANYCIFSISKTKSRENIFKWIGPISYVNNTAMWALKDRNIDVKNLNDAKNFTVAVTRDDMTHVGLLELGFKEGEQLYVLDNSQSLVNLLITRPEIDMIVANNMTVKFHIDQSGTSNDNLQRVYVIKELPLNFYFACSKKTTENIINQLTESLQSIYQDGSYEIIWEKWREKIIGPTLLNND